MSTHAVAIAAPRNLSGGSAPYLLDRDDADFIPAVLAELPAPGGEARLQSTRASARDGSQVLKLFQPVQRRFHVGLIEAWCETAGRPRVDPLRVEAAGMVVRRVRGGVVQGWMRAGGVLRGWLPIDRLGGSEADPMPSVRLARRDTGVASIDLALRALSADQESSLLEEDVTRMFVAPPDVCSRAGRTVYYGIVPTASSELAQQDPDLDDVFAGFGPESDAFQDHLVQPLRGLSYTLPTPPPLLTDRRFDKSWLQILQSASVSSSQHRFLQLLRQLVVEFDLFGDSAESRSLLATLRDIHLEYALLNDEVTRGTVRASDFLSEAARVLFEGGEGQVEMPERWPEQSASASVALAQRLSGAMRERFRSVKGRPGRFDDPDATYVLRAFVRVHCECGCGPKTIWSDYTEPFVIAPWYETAGNPVQVALPDLSDRNLLKSLKPNVAFTLPPALQNLLTGDPTKLMEGSGEINKLGIGWICSFSIPVITFCAFIVLNIFLSLFDLIFRWMAFIKICIPYPKAK
jgi:hypothetical protein